MKPRSLLLLFGLATPALLNAQGNLKSSARPAPPENKAAGLSNAAYIKLAVEGAPASISSHAAIARIDNGKFTVIRPGTNGFTCFYGIPGDPTADPICSDANALQFMADALAGKPKPTNRGPGIAYMAKGGSHYEDASGQAVMQATSKVGHEPPHWMLLWPVDKSSGISTKPGAPVYIMFPGTPYAHLMVYQDPATIVK